jgi:hypothetical protein
VKLHVQDTFRNLGHKRFLRNGRMWTGLNWLRKIIYINIIELNIYLVEFAFLDVPSPDNTILFLRTNVTYPVHVYTYFFNVYICYSNLTLLNIH